MREREDITRRARAVEIFSGQYIAEAGRLAGDEGVIYGVDRVDEHDF